MTCYACERRRDRIEELEFLLSEVTTGPDALDPDMAKACLTVQEADLLRFLRRDGMRKSRPQILTAVCWRRPEGDWPELKLVDVLSSKIRRKFRDAGLPNPIRTVWGVGYQAEPTHE